jgi:hypothetical protein
VRELQSAGLRVSAATGVMTSSPLASTEARAVLDPLGVRVLGTYDLTASEVAVSLLERAK